MAMAERQAQVVWEGTLREGNGTATLGSGAAGTLPVTWAARTEQPGGKTSPEELIAAAHATCYAMNLSSTLTKDGTPPQRLTVRAVCTLDRVDGAPTITTLDLTVNGTVPGLDSAGFEREAQKAEETCPVSKALRGNVQIRLHTQLE